VQSTSLEHFEETAVLRINPNPNTGNFSLLLQSVATLSIHNMQGSIVYQADLEPGMQQLRLTSPTAGMYFLITLSGTVFEILEN
jgi:hypothetical protein